jgi:hypothetical protein
MLSPAVWYDTTSLGPFPTREQVEACPVVDMTGRAPFDDREERELERYLHGRDWPLIA